MPSSRFFRSIWPALALGAVLTAANWELINKRESPPFDAAALFGPYHHLVAAFALEGRWLSWDPWTNAGTPEYAEPQLGAYSPLLLLTAYMGNASEAGFRWYWLIVWLIGGLGILPLGRHLRAPRWGTAACAIAWAMSGFYIGNAEHTPLLYTVSCLPWLIWRADVAMQRRSWLAGAQAGAILGLSALGGYPGLVILNAGYATLWTIGRALTTRTPPRAGVRPRARVGARSSPRSSKAIGLILDVRHAVVVLALIASISAIVMAAQYVPFFVDAAGFASRTGALPRDVAVFQDALVPGALLTAASPAITLLFPMDTDMSMRSVYLGALAPLLATFALCCRGSLRSRAGRWRLWLAALAVMSVLCALGATFPFRGWVYDCCVPFRYFRHAALFRVYLLFSAIVLALYGCRDLAALSRVRWRPGSRARPRRTAYAWALLLPAVLALSIALTLVFTPHALVVWTFAPLLLIALTRRRDTSTSTSQSQPGPRPRPTWLAAGVVGLAMIDGIWTAQLAGPLLHQFDPAWYQRSDVRFHSLDLTRRGLARDIEGLANANLWQKRPVVRSYTAFTNPWYAAISKHPVFERAASQPQRIFFVANAGVPAPILTDDDRVLASLLARATALDKPVLVLHQEWAIATKNVGKRDSVQNAIAMIANLPPAEAIDVHLDRYEPDELTFSTTTPRAGWLLVTDRWAKGWSVTVNDVPTPLFIADFVFRAVQVPAGRVQVRFTYKKSHGPGLVALSWSTCALLLIVAPLARVTRLARRQR